MQASLDDPASITAPAATSPRRQRGSVIAVVVATIVATAPIFVAAARHLGRATVLWGDSAIIQMLTRDVFTGRVPLVGFDARPGFYYPGPISYYLAAPLSWLSGHEAWALIVSYALIQAVAVVWAARLAWRTTHHLTFVLTVLAIDSLTYVALRHEYPFTSPWNPYIVIPFLLLLGLQVWSIGLGDYRQIPWAVGIATFIVQTNIGYLLLVLVLLGWSLWRTRPRKSHAARGAEWYRRVKIGAVVAAVMWLPPIIQQLRDGTHGNLYTMARYFVGQRLPTLTPVPDWGTLGFSAATHILAAEFQLVPPWFGGPTEPVTNVATYPSRLWLLVPLVLIAVGLLAARRHQNRPAQYAVELAGLLGLAGVVSLTVMEGPPSNFDYFWRVPVAIMIVAASVGAVVTTSRIWRRRTSQIALGVVLSIVILASCLVNTSSGAKENPDNVVVARTVERLVAQVRPAEWSSKRIQLRGEIGAVATIANVLDRHGYRWSFSRRIARFRYEDHHGSALSKVDSVWFVVPGVQISRLARLPGARVVALLSPLSTADESRVRALQSLAAQRLERAGRCRLIHYLDSPFLPKIDSAGHQMSIPGFDAAAVTELNRLNAASSRSHGWRYAIVAFAPAKTPPSSVTVVDTKCPAR